MPALILVILPSFACSDDSTDSTLDLGADAAPRDAFIETEPSIADVSAQPEGIPYVIDTGPVDGLDADLVPGPRLIIEQIYLQGTTTGESMLVVGPDGTSVLIDTGGSDHAQKILEAIDRRLGQRVVDWLVITHFHSDHVGSFHDLVTSSSANGGQPVQVTHGVITRGFYDINSLLLLAKGSLRDLCQDLGTSTFGGKRIDLCSGPQPAPCSGLGSGSPWPAAGCDGLVRGDLLDASDDNQNLTSFIELGDGARIYFFHANGHVATSEGVTSAEAAGVDIGHGGTGPENGRSLGGVIQWGDFSYSFHGDLTSEVEQFVTFHKDTITASPAGGLLLPYGALDVTHLNHHALMGSTSQPWVDWLLPNDGQNRNAVVGSNNLYMLSPDPGVLGRVGPRVSNGYIWITDRAPLGGLHPRLRETNGAVVVRVSNGGASYDIFAHTSAGATMHQSYISTVP